MRSALLLIVSAIVVAFVARAYTGSGFAPGAGGGPGALTGAPAQSFAALRLDGRQDALANYRGHVVLVNLWASWCTPCREEMPDLERLYREQRPHGLVVLGIDQGESAEAAGAFAREHGVTFPILLDQEQRYGRAYAAVGLPTSLVVDRTGRIARGIDGALSLAEMRSAVGPALAAR